MKAINIKWDVDYEEDLKNLPTKIEIPDYMTDEDEISDYISDVTGFCHYGFELEYEITDFKELTKTVHVSDPDCWYGKDTVKVSLRVLPPYKGETAVRVLVESIDDFMIYYDYECNYENKALVKWKYDHIKKYMYDAMPETISVDWLYKHGYLPF